MNNFNELKNTGGLGMVRIPCKVCSRDIVQPYAVGFGMILKEICDQCLGEDKKDENI